MQDLLNTIATFAKAFFNFKITDFYSFAAAILKAFGYSPEFSDPFRFSRVGEWYYGMVDVLGSFFTVNLPLPNTEQVIEIVNRILAFLNL